MWTARILMLILLLLAAGGWFDALLPKRKKTAILLLLPAVFAASYVPTLREPSVRMCTAPCAFALLCALLFPTDHPLGALTAALLGGMVGWKLCDVFPLFPEQGLLIAAPTVLLAALYCRDASAKALAIAAAPFVMLFLRAVGDYLLFKSAVLELGCEDTFAAQTIGSALLLMGESALARLRLVQRRAHAAA